MTWNKLPFTVIVPAFNEEGAILSTLGELRQHFPGAEILVVDDGSTDHTALSAEAVPGVRVLRHDVNRGYGAAIKTGIRHAAHELVAWYDADGQHTPHNLELLMDRLVTNELHAAIGARARGSAIEGRRVVGKAILGFIVQFVAGRRLPDVNCGLRVVRRYVLRRYSHLLPDGFSASITSMLLMLKGGYRVEFVPIVTRPRTGISTVRTVRDGIVAIQTSLRILVLFQAFHAFSAVAAILFIVGSTYGTAMALTFRLGFPTLASVLVLSGVIIFFMGLLTDQVVALRMERLEESSQEDRTPGASVH